MTLSTSVNKEGTGQSGCGERALVVYICVTLFCLVFYLIYNIFSHGVHSPYMTYLFAWPLVLGVLPSGVMWGVYRCGNQKSKDDGRKGSAEVSETGVEIWRAGVAAVTVSSCLRGIFEIAGTASVYQEWLMAAGAVMLVVGAALVIKKRLEKSIKNYKEV